MVNARQLIAGKGFVLMQHDSAQFARDVIQIIAPSSPRLRPVLTGGFGNIHGLHQEVQAFPHWTSIWRAAWIAVWAKQLAGLVIGLRGRSVKSLAQTSGKVPLLSQKRKICQPRKSSKIHQLCSQTEALNTQRYRRRRVEVAPSYGGRQGHNKPFKDLSCFELFCVIYNARQS